MIVKLLVIFAAFICATEGCHRRCRDEIDEELIPHFGNCLAVESGDNTTDFAQLTHYTVYYDIWYQAIATSYCPYPSSFFALSESDTHFCWILQLPSLLPYGSKYYEPLKQCIFQFSTIRDKQRGGGPARTPCPISSLFPPISGVTPQRPVGSCPKTDYTKCLRGKFKMRFQNREGKKSAYDMSLLSNFLVNIRTDKCTLVRSFFENDETKLYSIACPDSVKPPRPGQFNSRNPKNFVSNPRAEGTCFPIVLQYTMNPYEPTLIRAVNACTKVEATRENARKQKQRQREAAKRNRLNNKS